MRENTIRVLLIDDDKIDAEITERALQTANNPRFDVVWATSLANAVKRIECGRFDVALLDLGLPDSPPSETLERFRASCSSDFPIIVLTGLDDDVSALKSLDLGAQDFLSKDDITGALLSRSIRYAMQRHHLLDEITSANAMLEQKNERLAQLYNLAQQFVENVSHEFRTPLTVIREFTSIVCDGLDGPITPKQAEHLEKVLHRTDDLALMVDDMLDISRLEAGLLGVWRLPYSVGDLVETTRGLVKGRADSKQISLKTAVDGNLPLVFCDEEKARRVIINLAVNAIKFTPAGGTVEIWARNGSGDDEVTVGISDTGPGLCPESLSVIFERFRQVDQGLRSSTKGFGLGLNIAKELVALNLGQIHVESEVGAGSTFSFTLPKFEPRTLVTRYLTRVATQLGNDAQISLFTASVDAIACPSAVPVTDEFLQRSMLGNDLVASFDEGRWVIAAACPAGDYQRLIDRLLKEWAGLLRNSPRLGLLPLKIEYRQSFVVGRERDDLIDLYLELASAPERPAPERPAPANQTVLVVDDDQEVSHCLGVRLKAAGFQVISATDGEEGLATALAQRPDAVVLDVRMPKKDGLAVLRELRSNPSTETTPIVMLSASIRDQHPALEAGASYFVPKPYEATQVLSALKSSFHQEIIQ